VYLLNVVVAQSAAILKLLAGEDQTLLVRGNALLVLDLGLDVVDGVARLDVEGNGLTRQGLDEAADQKLSAHYPLGIILIVIIIERIVVFCILSGTRDGGEGKKRKRK
jgi:hypothetical protein